MHTRLRFEATMFILAMGAIGCRGGGSGGGGNDVGAGAAGIGAAGTGTLLTQSVNLPGCEDGEPNLLEGFTLGRDVDYIADRFGGAVLSERGVACAGATDPALCQNKLAAAGDFFIRNLLTTERGEVRVWEGPAAVALFGSIDTVSEAAWLASAFEYHVPCDAVVARVFDVYLFDGVEARFGCLETQALVTISVNARGDIGELNFEVVQGALCEPDPATQGFAGGSPVAPPPPVPL